MSLRLSTLTQRDRRVERGGADRPGRAVRVRREARLHRRAAHHHRRPADQRGGCRQQRADARARPSSPRDSFASSRVRASRAATGAESRGGARRRPRTAGAAAGAGAAESGSAVNLSEIFIRRPIATSLLMGGDRACSACSRTAALPVSDLPQVDYPTLNVQRGAAGRAIRTRWHPPSPVRSSGSSRRSPGSTR